MTRPEDRRHSGASQNDSFNDISDRLNEMLRRSRETGERLEKLERLRKPSDDRMPLDPSRPNLGSVFPPATDSQRPPRTEFRVSRKRAGTRSHDVSIEQIFEALQALREEVAELSENHTEMVEKINTIKRLIH
jgi:methyl-accepting chemotaxis protein